MLQFVKDLPLNPAMLDKLLDIVAKEGMVDREKLSLDSSLDSLGVKSVDVVVVLMAVEEQFGVYIPVDDKALGTRLDRSTFCAFAESRTMTTEKQVVLTAARLAARRSCLNAARSIAMAYVGRRFS